MKKEYRCTLRTKKMIRAAFVELLGEKKNMETITVGELAERADIAKSTFYNHYDDVYAVAEEFENELIAKLSAVLDEIELERSSEYESYFRKVIEFLKMNEDIKKLFCETNKDWNAINSARAKYAHLFTYRIKILRADRFSVSPFGFVIFLSQGCAGLPSEPQ